jgi:Tfp pilus assembly protein PilX
MPEPSPVPARRTTADEAGFALVLALVVMLVLSIALTTVTGLSSAGSREASRGNAGQQAYALAEEGISNALSVLGAAPTTRPPAAATTRRTTTGEGSTTSGREPSPRAP